MTIGSVYNQKTGDVWLDDYDRGVIVTLGGVINEHNGVVKAGSMYVLKNIPRVTPPSNYDGVPVFFSYPDESIDNKILPSFIVRRDSVTPAMSRWHLGSDAYNIPAVNAKAVTVNNPRTGNVIAQGFDQYERKDQAVPYDITYNIQIRARYRNNLAGESLQMLKYLMRVYQPYTRLSLVDSLGDTRYYDAFTESPSGVDMMPDIESREANFNLTLRVEGELDLNDPYVIKSMSQLMTVNYSVNE